MLRIVTITSKRQITIPAKIFDRLQLKEGDKLIAEVDSNKITLQKAQQVLDELAGSLRIPRRYKNKSLNFIIKEAKKEYFSTKK